MAIRYPIRAAAKLTGLSVDTLRAWERRYKAVTPERSERGRLYGDAEIRRLLLLRSAVEAGFAIGQVASLSDEELVELERAPGVAVKQARQNEEGEESVPEVLRTLLDAVRAYDYRGASAELERLALLMTPHDLVYSVVLPAMRHVGEGWEKGTFQVAQEHLLSACVRNLLGSLVRLQRAINGAPRILFATPAGELHEFGILAAAVLAVAHQVEVAYLGPNLPAGEILSAAAMSSSRVAAIGITQRNPSAAIRADLQRLADELPDQVELWLGGCGAAAAIESVSTQRAVRIEDLKDFERHLVRLKALSHLEFAS